MLRVEVNLEGKSLEEVVDEDIAQFEEFFRSLGNDPLSPFEKSAIKTFLHWKTHGEKDAKEAGSSL